MRKNNLEILDIFLNKKDCLVCIIDIKTSEVLYVNENVKRMFKGKNTVGQKYYEIFQNYKKLYYFQKIEKYEKEFYISEYYNEKLNKYFKVRERIITWIDGRDVKLEIAKCISKEVDIELRRIIGYERKLEEILDEFENRKGMEYLVNKILKIICEYTRASRAYIFDMDLFGNFISNRYEWSNKGAELRIRELNSIFCSDVPWWMSKLLNDEVIFISNIDEMPKEAKNERVILKERGVKSLIGIPLKIFGQLYGFVGIDNVDEYSVEAGKNMESLMIFVGVISKIMESNYKGTNDKRMKNIYDTMLEITVNPTAIIGKRGNIIVYNQELRDFMELDKNECIRGIFLNNYLDPEIDAENKENKVYKIQTKTGRKYGIVTSKKIINSEQYIVTLFDITDIKNKEKELEVLSYTDKLTNLYNRNKYIRDVGEMSRDKVRGLGVVICDIDGLKIINDSLGHDYGDRIIRRFAKVLWENTKKEDLKYRIGGDEFIIINKNISKERVTEIVESIKGNIRKINKSQNGYFVSVSIGVAYSNKKSIDELIKEADLNMYREKVLNNKNVINEIINGFTRALEVKDYNIVNRGKRMEKYALQIGDKLFFSEKRKEKLSLLCKFHDIGKIAIENEILFKRDELTKEEFEKTKKHSEIGYRISRNSKVLKGISDFILKHHERYDGKGYPLGLKGKGIPLECRIIAVIDAFDDIVNESMYKKVKSKDFAMQEIRKGIGTQFDPDISRVFLDILENE